jgi:predicted TIM-barrel fold metal-dependent hydrolase
VNVPLRIVDCDVHCAVPSAAALAPYLPDFWRDFLAEIEFTVPQAVRHAYPSPGPLATDADATGYERVSREALAGVEAAILNCLFGIESQRNPFLAAALATAVNDWLKEEWLERDARLRASLVVVPHDTEAAVAEIERAAAGCDRLVQVLVPARAWEPYGNRRYWPIWRAAVEHGLAVGVHFGGLAGLTPTPVGGLGGYAEEYAAAGGLFQSHLLSFVAEGVFDVFPDLRVTLVESGVTWLPTFLWKVDTDWKGHRREIPWVRERPSEYVRRHVRLTTQPLDAPADDGDLDDVLRQLGGSELLLFASDFPHDHGCDARRLFGRFPAAEAERVAWANASEWYRLG